MRELIEKLEDLTEADVEYTIRTHSGDKQVTGKKVGKYLAIHKEGSYYNITHIASGRMVDTFSTKGDAQKAASAYNRIIGSALANEDAAMKAVTRIAERLKKQGLLSYPERVEALRKMKSLK